MQYENKEHELLDRIQSSKSVAERDALVDELEMVPTWRRTFYSRWLFIHDVRDVYYECWSDNGYDPTKSEVPRDIQLLAATDYGKSDIDNGGLHQFFSNGTGVFAPEMVEWFDRVGLTETAGVIRKAMAVFGPEFPRSQLARQEFLAGFNGNARSECDPFFELDDRFYAPFKDRELFDGSANTWLRETCGITSLRDSLRQNQAMQVRTGNG